MPVAGRALVGREIDRDAARPERHRQRLGGKQMSAGAAGREQDERRLAHQAAFHSGGGRSTGSSIAMRGRSRVSASSMPMP